jgi:endonuclease/exonuclease/phosphatase (EEP) superfamily protein YafD
VLSVAELPPPAIARLSAAGLDRLLPYRVLRPAPGAQGTGLYARLPLTDAGELSEATTFAQARALTVVGGRPVELIAVHPAAPRPGDVGKWRRDLGALPATSCAGPVRILAGDFNATLDHRLLRGLLERGYVDAADAVGAGLRPTWPADRLGPGLQIDHVLVDQRMAVRAVRVHHVPGSDHRALLAELSLRAG